MSMLFKDIKQGHTIHILDKEEMRYMQCKALAVSFPHMAMMQNGGTQSVVDVNVEMEGKTATYSIPEHLAVTYAGNLVLSTDAEGLSREVETMKNTAEQILCSVDKQKKVIDKASDLLVQLNPSFREKKNIEDRFNKIENNMEEMKNMLSGFIKEFSK